MSAKIIEIPDFNFSSFYYPEILEALIQYKRRNVPELTDESEFEPLIQLLRAFALVGHLNNTLLDLVANESTLPTARLADTVRNMLRVIDYRLAPATPASVAMVYKLSKIFTSPFKIIPKGSQISTLRQGNNQAISYEATEDVVVSDTGKFSHVWMYFAETGLWQDVTEIANTGIGSFSFADGQIKTGDTIYFGHSEVMWDAMRFSTNNAIGGFGYIAVWEYYDGDSSRIQADEVVQVGNKLRLTINGLLGIETRAGTVVRVTLNSDGAYEDAISQWDGTKNYVQIGFLGQTSPTKKPNDYSVGSEWVELSSEDKTQSLFSLDEINFELPQDLDKNWSRLTVGPTNQPGFGTENAYWIRFRIVSAVSAISPLLSSVRMDIGGQYVLHTATQGQQVYDNPIGSSTGLPDQVFRTTQDFYIVGTIAVTVDNEEWTLVDNFFNSSSSDKHYTITIGSNDRVSVNFGSGFQGKIPPIGIGNIAARYRVGANFDGNVGPNTIVQDKTGLTYVDSLYNPRQAGGWKEAEGSTQASIQRAKVAGPASIRIRETAIGTDDVAFLATRQYVSASGANPYSRVLPIEEGLGPKTIELIVVKRGGALATTQELQELTTYFNGSDELPQRIVANQRIYAFNYIPRVINIEAIVYSDEVTEKDVENHLRLTIQPEALMDDKINYKWKFGALVPRSRLNHEIFSTNKEKISNVVLVQPSADVTMGKRELPVVGTVSITIRKKPNNS